MLPDAFLELFQCGRVRSPRGDVTEVPGGHRDSRHLVVVRVRTGVEADAPGAHGAGAAKVHTTTAGLRPREHRNAAEDGRWMTFVPPAAVNDVPDAADRSESLETDRADPDLRDRRAAGNGAAPRC